MKRWFLTAQVSPPKVENRTNDWRDKGNRGIFCDVAGNPFSKETQHTRDEMREILGAFWAILSPQSIELDEAELEEYCVYHPLVEYSNQYGIVCKVMESTQTENEISKKIPV